MEPFRDGRNAQAFLVHPMGALPPPASQRRPQPCALAGAEERRQESASERDDSFDLGGELKWLPRPATVVDFTVNTDFAQVDVDRQVVNLSRFSVLFPEQRPFFLENAGLFDSGFDGLKPFFSRRIGLDDSGRPVPIDAGLRLAHQDGERSWGGLLARTAGTGPAPASTFAVARFSENLGDRHRLGGMVVGRRDERSAGDRTNTVATIDGLYRPRELFTLKGLLSASATSGEGGDGIAGELWACSQGPRGYFGWIQLFVSDDYEAGSGFVSRRDQILTSPAVTLDWRPAWLPQANGSEVWAWWEPTAQRLDAPFAPLPGLEVAAGDYDFERWGIAAASDRSRPYGLEVRHTFGGFYDGHLENTTVTARAASRRVRRSLSTGSATPSPRSDPPAPLAPPFSGAPNCGSPSTTSRTTPPSSRAGLPASPGRSDPSPFSTSSTPTPPPPKPAAASSSGRRPRTGSWSSSSPGSGSAEPAGAFEKSASCRALSLSHSTRPRYAFFGNGPRNVSPNPAIDGAAANQGPSGARSTPYTEVMSPSKRE